MLNPGASRSCHSQASAPPGSTPIARSWINRGPDRLAASSCSVTRSCSHAWKSTRSRSEATARSTAGSSGCLSSAGHERQLAPCRSARAQKRAHPSRAAPCSVRQAASRCRPDGARSAQRSFERLALPPPALVAVDDGLGEPRLVLALPSAATAALRPPGASSTRRRRGLRHRRLEGKYGLLAIGEVGVGACSGLRARNPAPSSCSHVARLRTSARSPMPQLSRDRVVGTWTTTPQARRSSGRWHRPGPTSNVVTGPPSRGARSWSPRGRSGGRRSIGAEVRSVLQRQVTAAVQHLGRSGSHDPQGPAVRGRIAQDRPHGLDALLRGAAAIGRPCRPTRRRCPTHRWPRPISPRVRCPRARRRTLAGPPRRRARTTA